jgi:hypothetical protein
MAGKADFTKEEWEALQRGVTGAGILVSNAHRGFTESFGEAKAIAADLGKNRDSPSELVRELASTHGTGFGVVASPKEVQGVIDALAGAVATLTQKAPDEVEPYRTLVLEVANAVAEAKGGVAPEETAAIEQIKAALGAS